MAFRITQKMVNDAVDRMVRSGDLTAEAAREAKVEIWRSVKDYAPASGKVASGRKYGEGGKTTQRSERVGNAISTRIDAGKALAPKARAQALLKSVQNMIDDPKHYSRRGLEEFQRIKAEVERVLTLTKEMQGTTPAVRKALKEKIAELLDDADAAHERVFWKYGLITDEDIKGSGKSARALIDFAKTLKNQG